MVDTNVLVYAANRDCVEHEAAQSALEGWLNGAVPWALGWNIVYEFLRVVTHPKVFRYPLRPDMALAFVEPIVGSERVTLIGPTPRHATLLRRTIDEFGVPTGNIFHDLHTAVLMREHGVVEIMTADTDFRKFAFLTVTDPVH
jgi:toxin-antitoxin system PIN domain toxin